MARKENKGGVLKNSQIEQEQQRTGHSSEPGYHGVQDTGDESVRNLDKKQEGTSEETEHEKPERG